jgi:hypothetical protein
LAAGLQLKFVPRIATLAVEPSIRKTMGSPSYLDQVVVEIGEVSERILVLNDCFAGQRVSVKQAHYEELTRVRTRLAEFRLSVEALDKDEVGEQDQQGVEFARESLMDAVETLLAVLR